MAAIPSDYVDPQSTYFRRMDDFFTLPECTALIERMHLVHGAQRNCIGEDFP